MIEEGPGAVFDLQARPQREPHLAAIGEVDVHEGRRGIDLVAEHDGDPGLAQRGGEAGDVRDEVGSGAV